MSREIPKAITPQQVRDSHTADDGQAFDAAVATINRELQDATNPEHPSVHIYAKGLGCLPRVRDRVAQHFRQAGWKVEFVSDQRDGDYYRFTA